MILGRRELDGTRVGKPTHMYHYLYKSGVGVYWRPIGSYYPDKIPVMEIMWGLPVQYDRELYR